MEQISSSLKRAIIVSATLTLISTIIVVGIGYSLLNINREIKILNHFLTSSANIQANFEKSLQIYTENTQDIIDFLLSLRPDSEEKYIEFISAIENVAQDLAINIDLQSITEIKGTKKGTKKANPDTLDYQIRFYGSLNQLNRFIAELEKSPYFINVATIEYTNPQTLISSEKSAANINLVINLFTRNESK